MNALLKVEQLCVSVAGKAVCHDLDFSVTTGQCWGVLGANGIGKTTLLHTLAGLRTATSGRILLEGAGLAALSRRHIARHIGVLFQDVQDAFPASVLETVLIGRHPYLKGWAWEGTQDFEMARRALADTGLQHLEQRLVTTLSGGERRRVALAAVLTQNPALYLLDEPANHLDLHQQIAVLDLLTQRVRNDGKAVLMTVHDVNLAARYCDRVLLLFGEGESVHGPTAEVLTPESLQRLYRHPVVNVAGPRGNAFLPG